MPFALRTNTNTYSSHRYNSAPSAASYVNWPDSRLRAYLVERGIISAPPTTRELLLQKVRENWSEPPRRGVLERLRDVVHSGVGRTEEKFARVVEILEEAGTYVAGALILALVVVTGGAWMRGVDANAVRWDALAGKAGEGQEYVKEKAGQGQEYVKEKAGQGQEYVKEKAGQGQEYVKEKTEQGQEYVTGWS
jgi:hypothetical protein